jgi:nuclear cap-binding protein subunit 2
MDVADPPPPSAATAGLPTDLDLLREAISSQPSKRRPYWDRSNYDSLELQEEACKSSCTLYAGGLDAYTSEQQIYEVFRHVGPVKMVVMGLHRLEKTPCGFCFVEYFDRANALVAERLCHRSELDGRQLDVQIDPGFKEGRQFGRGRTGGQVKAEPRELRFTRGHIRASEPSRGGGGGREPSDYSGAPPPARHSSSSSSIVQSLMDPRPLDPIVAAPMEHHRPAKRARSRDSRPRSEKLVDEFGRDIVPAERPVNVRMLRQDEEDDDL